MAVDVAGPFAPGCDQDMGQPRYFLVTTVTVPVRHDKPLIWGWKPDDSVEGIEEGAEHVFQDRQEILPEVQEPNPFKGDGEEAVVCEEEVKLASFEQQMAELKRCGSQTPHPSSTSVEPQGGNGDRCHIEAVCKVSGTSSPSVPHQNRPGEGVRIEAVSRVDYGQRPRALFHCWR